MKYHNLLILNIIFRVFTIFHYEKFFRGGESGADKFFNGYVNAFLKLKLEASGRYINFSNKNIANNDNIKF